MTRVVTVLSTAILVGKFIKQAAAVISVVMALIGIRSAALFLSEISIYAKSVCVVVEPFPPKMLTISSLRNMAEQMKTATWRRYVGHVTRQKLHGNA